MWHTDIEGAIMPVMAKERKKGSWPDLLTKLQSRLAKTNADMATKFHVSVRTYLGWKYGEKVPGLQAQELIRLAIQGKY